MRPADLEQLARGIAATIVPAIRDHIDRRESQQTELLQAYTRSAVKEAIAAERKRNRQVLGKIERGLAELDARTKRADAIVDLGQRRAR